MMFDERKKRSSVRHEALQFLIEAVLDRSEVTCAAILDADRRIVAGAGDALGLGALARVANDVARGNASVLDEDDGESDDDIFARAIEVNGETYVLAALGSRVRRMPNAAKAVARIYETTNASSW